MAQSRVLADERPDRSRARRRESSPTSWAFTRQTVDAIELGGYSPSLEVAFKIAVVLGVPLNEVFQYPDRSTTSP